MQQKKYLTFSLKVFLVIAIILNLGYFCYQQYQRNKRLLLTQKILEKHKKHYSIEELRKLTLLDLSSTNISDQGLASLKELSKLSTLYLRRTKITDHGFVHLKDLLKLSFLDISETEITIEALDELRKGLPNCKIDW